MPAQSQSVFISYRRDDQYTALLIYKTLRNLGYDVFLDLQNLDSGKYEPVLLNQIAARPHFILILTPDSLKRCHDPKDWIRREIERAMDLERNIIPLMFNGFKFKDATSYLTGKLARLPEYNGLEVPSLQYFDHSIELLRERYLSIVPTGQLQPTPPEEERAVRAKIEEADQHPRPNTKQLDAEEYNRRGIINYQRGDLDIAIRHFSHALKMDPQFALVYFNRGVAREESGDFTGAIEDYTQTLAFASAYIRAYERRATVRYHVGDLKGAIEDYNELCQRKPENDSYYALRGTVRRDMADFRGARDDFNYAIKLNPHRHEYFYHRALTEKALNRIPEAVEDIAEALRLKFDFGDAHFERGLILFERGKYLESIADFNATIRFEPNFADAYYYRAVARERRRVRGLRGWQTKQEVTDDYQRYVDLGGRQFRDEVERKLRNLKRRV